MKSFMQKYPLYAPGKVSVQSHSRKPKMNRNTMIGMILCPA